MSWLRTASLLLMSHVGATVLGVGVAAAYLYRFRSVPDSIHAHVARTPERLAAQLAFRFAPAAHALQYVEALPDRPLDELVSWSEVMQRGLQLEVLATELGKPFDAYRSAAAVACQQIADAECTGEVLGAQAELWRDKRAQSLAAER